MSSYTLISWGSKCRSFLIVERTKQNPGPKKKNKQISRDLGLEFDMASISNFHEKNIGYGFLTSLYVQEDLAYSYYLRYVSHAEMFKGHTLGVQSIYHRTSSSKTSMNTKLTHLTKTKAQHLSLGKKD